MFSSHSEGSAEEAVSLLAVSSHVNDYGGDSLLGGLSGSPIIPPGNFPEISCWPLCCSVFSSVAILYLVLMGIYASSGWNFHPEIWTVAQKGTAAYNFYWAAFLYSICLVASLYFLVQQRRRSTSYRNARTSVM